MKTRFFALLAALVLVGGCFEIDHAIRIEKDLSGTADFHLGVDLEPMVVVMAQLAREMEGKTGPLTAEDLAKAKADFAKGKSGSSGEPPSREEIEKSMPEGVKLLDFKFAERELGMVSDFKFGFDRLSRLVNVKLPGKEGGDPTQKNVIDSPFEGLEVTEDGDKLIIRSKAQNPTAAVEKEAEGGPKLDAATEKLVRDAFKKMRVSYRITAPFPVVSHNATRREGNTLIWEYDLERFEKEGAGVDSGVMVTYKR
jgi:hypothetical protein